MDAVSEWDLMRGLLPTWIKVQSCAVTRCPPAAVTQIKSLLPESPGQFFLLFPVPSFCCTPTLCSWFLIVQEGERSNPELLDIPPFILDVNRELGLFCSFTFYSPSLPFCSPHHTKLLSSPCACSQLLNSLFPGSGWAGIFDHRALFCIHVFFGRVMTCSGAITFCCFWIPVAPAGINHWSWVSGALPWST